MSRNSPRIRRNQIPPELCDVSIWPPVDPSALSSTKKAAYEKRLEAMILYVQPEVSLATIEERTGVSASELSRLFDRCMATHEDGRMYGQRGLIPWLHTAAYRRTKPVGVVEEGSRGGASGGIYLLMETYPKLKEWLDGKIRVLAKGGNSRKEVTRSIPELHRQLLKQCKALGVGTSEYPLNRERAGLRSLPNYVAARALALDLSIKTTAETSFPSRAWKDDPELVPRGVLRPYEAVEFDGHKIDGRFTIKIQDPFGFETILKLRRLWILLLIDVATRAVLGYYIALSREYNKDDVAAAFQAALAPHTPPAITIAALTPDPAGGFPSTRLPQTAYACWDVLRFDAAKSHFAITTLERATEFIGCWTDNAVLGDKNARATVEQYFNVIAKHFAHRLPATTGSNPDSVERVLNDPKGDTSLMMTVDELQQVIDVVISDSNARRLPGLSNRTPLEAMQFMLERDQGFIRTLPLVRRRHLNLLRESRVSKVCGNRAKARVPHINFAYVRYSSERLSHAWHLLAKGEKRRLRIYFDIRDIRHLQAFTEDGQFFDTLTADRPWCFTPHPLWLRKEIFRCYRKGLIERNSTSDPVQVFWEHLRTRAGNSGYANELARVLADRASLAASSGVADSHPSHQIATPSSMGATSGPPHRGLDQSLVEIITY